LRVVVVPDALKLLGVEAGDLRHLLEIVLGFLLRWVLAALVEELVEVLVAVQLGKVRYIDERRQPRDDLSACRLVSSIKAADKSRLVL
jgi:hypothetical protein